MNPCGKYANKKAHPQMGALTMDGGSLLLIQKALVNPFDDAIGGSTYAFIAIDGDIVSTKLKECVLVVVCNP